MVGDESQSDMQRKHFSCVFRDDMKSRRRCIASCNAMRGDAPTSVSWCSLRSQQVLKIDWVTGDIYGASSDVARTAEAHSVGAWSFVFSVLPGIKEQGYEVCYVRRKHHSWDARKSWGV